MERNRRESIYGWVLIAVLVASAIGLAAMQFRWIGELSLGERERMQRGLDSSLNAFTRDWAAGTRQAAEAISSALGSSNEEERALRWKKAAAEGRIFRRVVQVKGRGAERGAMMVLLELDLEHGTLQEIPRPAEWSNVLGQLEERIRLGENAPRGPIQLVEPDLLEAPLWSRGEGVSAEGGQPSSWLLLQLNLDLQRSEVLPELERRYINTQEPADYALRVAVKGGGGQDLYNSGWEVQDKFSKAADARVELNSGVIVERRGGRSHGRWELSVRHRSGSLEEFVERSRVRNLTLSAALLLVMLLMIAALWRFTRKAQQLADLQMEFVAGISHELKTPLTVIRTAAYNLSNGVVRVENQMQFQRYGAMILTQSDKLTGMVEQVLRFASVQAGRVIAKREAVQVESLVQEVLSNSQFLLAEADARVETQVDKELPSLYGDGLALQHALQNLISNAAKYGPRGGVIRFEASLAARMIRFRITDQGPGLRPGELDQIFVPFFRGKTALDEQIHGTGLGLSLVKNIAEAHGGNVSARNREGAGAEFLMEIPIAEGTGDEFQNPAG